MAAIFWDASALVPLVVTRDQWRPALERVLTGLRRAGAPSFVTSNWTLYEALAQAQRASKPIAVSLYRHVSSDFTITTVRPPEEQEALRRFLGWQDKFASVVDHANLLAALELGCEAILSFDADFEPLVKGAGLRLLR